VLGLGPGFCTSSICIAEDSDDEDEDEDDSDEEDSDEEEEDDDVEEAEKDQFQEAVSALTESMDGRVVGVWAKLDYTSAILERPGNDRETQLRRFRATCTAAVQCGVPIQVRLSPGASDDEEPAPSKAAKKGTMVSLSPYVQGVKDLAKVLLEFDNLKVHISCWNGTSAHMSKLLQAFPESLYIGLTAAVGFAKADVAHECAFDVPLQKLILETDTVIPAEVVTALGRKAFAHSGAVGFCAAAVAHHKKVPAKQVAKQASLNTVQLYGSALAARSKQAAEEAAVLEAERVIAMAEEEQEELVVAEMATQQEEDAEGTGPTKLTKKQKKKKKKKGGQQDQQSEDVDKDFDDEHLATLLDEKL
jgi:Tat protein secretion system quality control protein TatD with DNase activity